MFKFLSGKQGHLGEPRSLKDIWSSMRNGSRNRSETLSSRMQIQDKDETFPFLFILSMPGVSLFSG